MGKIYFVLWGLFFAGIAALLWNRFEGNDTLSAAGRFVRRLAIFYALMLFVTAFFGTKGWRGFDDLLFDLAFVGVVFSIGYYFLNMWGFGGGGEEHVRGTAVDDASKAARKLKNVPHRFKVGNVPVPRDLETRGILLAGAPGTGKSQTLTHALDALREEKSAAVIADASCIYVSRYYDKSRGDIIINPFDKRSISWSPLAEIESIGDIPALAKSMIPDAEGEAQEWNHYAQTFLEAILEHCFNESLNNRELFRLISVATIEELREICVGTPVEPMLADGNDRMFGSVRSIASSAVKGYQYLDPDAGVDSFSIRKHIEQERDGWIFISYQQQHRMALKSMIAACVDIASRAVLSLPPSFDRRVVFALDELSLLGKVQSIVDLATNGRKHGAVIIAGLQTIAQMRDAYGQETAQTLLACLGSWLVLRVGDAETAEYMSRYIGEEEKIRIVSSSGKNSTFMGMGSKSTSLQEQYTKDRAVLPSEIQRLPDMVGYFNLAGPTPTVLVKLDYAPERKKAEAFIPAQPKSKTDRAKTEGLNPKKEKSAADERVDDTSKNNVDDRYACY